MTALDASVDSHGHIVMSVCSVVVCTNGTVFFVCGLKCEGAHVVSDTLIEQYSSTSTVLTSTLTPR